MEKSKERQVENVPTPERVTNRRGFLTGLGMAGAAIAAGAGTAPAEAQEGAPAKAAAPAKLSSIATLSVTREEVLDVPGGKEYFYEWNAGDKQGVTTKFSVHGTRIEAGNTYTMTTDITVSTFASDQPAAPVRSDHQNVMVFAVKGPVDGSVRHDEMTITTVHADGSTNREQRTVPVRLDLAEFANQDFATLAMNAGRKYLPAAD